MASRFGETIKVFHSWSSTAGRIGHQNSPGCTEEQGLRRTHEDLAETPPLLTAPLGSYARACERQTPAGTGSHTHIRSHGVPAFPKATRAWCSQIHKYGRQAKQIPQGGRVLFPFWVTHKKQLDTYSWAQSQWESKIMACQSSPYSFRIYLAMKAIRCRCCFFLEFLVNSHLQPENIWDNKSSVFIIQMLSYNHIIRKRYYRNTHRQEVSLHRIISLSNATMILDLLSPNFVISSSEVGVGSYWNALSSVSYLHPATVREQ